MPFNLSTGELLVLAFVAIVVFGGRLPEVARKVGKTISEFKRGIADETHRMDRDLKIEDEPPAEWTPPVDGEECEGVAGGK